VSGQGVKCKLMNCSRNWCGSLSTLSPLWPYIGVMYTESPTIDAHGAYNNNNNINQYYSKYYFCHTYNIGVHALHLRTHGVFRFLQTLPPAVQHKIYDKLHF